MEMAQIYDVRVEHQAFQISADFKPHLYRVTILLRCNCLISNKQKDIYIFNDQTSTQPPPRRLESWPIDAFQ